MMTTNNNQPAYTKSESWQMFNNISAKYDLLNRLLSFGLDIHWRKCLAKFLPEKEHLHILDLATGTADVLLSFIKNSSKIKSATGIDMAEQMLEIGRKKIAKLKLPQKITLKKGNINAIPFAENTFDVTSIAFGIRNVENPSVVLEEMHRILSKDGRALILEFSLPDNAAMRALHLFYLRKIVPLIGGAVSGNYAAYKYLNQTIESFPYGDTFCALMDEAGFKYVKANRLLCGVATIYQGDKS